MKKIFILLIIVFVILSGCSGSTEISETDKPEIMATYKPEEIISADLPDDYIHVNQLNFFNMLGMEYRYYNLLDWENYIQEKYGIEIYIDYSTSYSSSIYYLNHSDMLSYFNASSIRDFIADGRGSNISAYYKKYGWDQYIEQKYINALSINKGIHAVPSAVEKYIVPRYYNEKYLRSLNKNVPGNTDELYEYLSGVKSMNKDNPQYYPIVIPGSHTLQSTSDIFRSFGAFVSTGSNVTCAFNPLTNSYEDAAFSDEFLNGLGYIRKLQNEKLLAVHGEGRYSGTGTDNIFIGDLTKLSKDFATEYMYTYNDSIKQFSYFVDSEPTYEHQNGYYLIHSNSDKVCEVRADMSFYVFNTGNINGVMDLFNQIMTDSNFYADLKYGIEGQEYLVSDDGIIPKQPSMGMFPDIRQLIPDNNKYALTAPGSIAVMENLDENMFYEMSFINDVTTYTEDTEKFRMGSIYIYDVFFCDSVSAEDAVEEYKRGFIERGLVSAINELNERLGTVPVFDYSN